MFRRLCSGAAGILLVALFFAGTAAAQESITGMVQTTTATTITIRLDSGEEVTLDMDSSTHLPKSMVPGDRVRINVREMGGQRLAGNVSLLNSTNAFSDEYASSTSGTDRPSVTYAARETRETDVASRTTTDRTTAAGETYAANEPATGTQTDNEYALPASDELPATAGQLPLIALTGLLALGGSVGIRFVKRRSSRPEVTGSPTPVRSATRSRRSSG